MPTTKYTVATVNSEGVATQIADNFSKKAKAVEFAEATRESEKVAVQVATSAGTVVLDLAAPRKIRMSPRYSKVQALPEGVALPEDANGMRVAYVRPRSNGAVLHDPAAGEYRILDLAKGKLVRGKFETTRAAGAYIAEGVGTVRRERAAAAQAEAPSPEGELVNV